MIGIIDYDAGNIESLSNAFKKLGVVSILSDNKKVLEKTRLLVLPGVGAAGTGMANLKRKKLDIFLREQIKRSKPFLGICLGMQLLFEKSEENNTTCLGILEGVVKKFRIEKNVPQIGWNEVKTTSRLFKNIPDKSFFYFVNSYYCKPTDKKSIVAETTYGEKFASVIAYKNIIATQFHPEKSGSVGFQLVQNILKEAL